MSSVEPFIVSLPLETLARNSGNATSRQRSKGLNINCSELFSPPVLLPGTAPQVQGSHRSSVECSVSITSTSHGAITREAAGHPFFLAPVPCQVPPAPHTHTHRLGNLVIRSTYTRGRKEVINRYIEICSRIISRMRIKHVVPSFSGGRYLNFSVLQPVFCKSRLLLSK